MKKLTRSVTIIPNANGAAIPKILPMVLVIVATIPEKLEQMSISLISWPHITPALRPTDSIKSVTDITWFVVLKRHRISNARAGPHVPILLLILRTTFMETPFRKAKSDAQPIGKANNHFAM